MDRKEYEFADYVSQVKRITSESEYEIGKLRDEKEKLRNEVLLMENARKSEV